MSWSPPIGAWTLGAVLAAWSAVTSALAALPGDAGSDAGLSEPLALAAPTADAGASGQPASPGSASCTEHLVGSNARPRLVERFPSRGKSGHAVLLEVVLDHGKGETVLPGGFAVLSGSPEYEALRRASFSIPDPHGTQEPTVSVAVTGDTARSTVRIPFVPLPPKPGRHQLMLPPVPIALARASGAVLTLCTGPHAITVDDPIANDPDPRPRQGLAPRRQLEEWTAAKHAALIAAIALLLGAAVAWLLGRWMQRPKPLPPPLPPRPPWEVALEELFDIRQARLVERALQDEHFDRVSLSVRKYLGLRFGFDGLESTTEETKRLLRVTTPPIDALPAIEAFLDQADLVKFAKLSPTEAECALALERGEDIVHRTIPSVTRPAQAPSAQAPSAQAPSAQAPSAQTPPAPTPPAPPSSAPTEPGGAP